MHLVVNRTSVALFLLGTIACSGAYTTTGSTSGSGSVGSDSVRVTGVRVTPQSVVIEGIGTTTVLTATVVPANATDKTVIWHALFPAVASVDSTGRVTANSRGEGAYITAVTRDGHFQSTANVTVIP